MATLAHRVAALSKVHQEQQWANPADSTELLATCGPDLPGVCDLALPYFGFASGGRRRGDPGAPARVARG